MAGKGIELPRVATERLAWLDEELAGREFIAGDRYTIADITALVAVDLGIPSVFEIRPDPEHVAGWHEAVSKRPSATA